MRPGNKANSCINGEWAKHVRWWYKRYTARKRRAIGKKIIKNELTLLSS